jgi:hypothetical protein
MSSRPAIGLSSSHDRSPVVIDADPRGLSNRPAHGTFIACSGSGDCGGQMRGETCGGLVAEARMWPRGVVVSDPCCRQLSGLSPQRFQQLQRVFGGPYSRGASHHRKPLRLIKIVPLGTRRSSTRGLPRFLGKKGSGRAICASVSQKRLLKGCSLIGVLAEPESCHKRNFNGSRPRGHRTPRAPMTENPALRKILCQAEGEGRAMIAVDDHGDTPAPSKGAAVPLLRGRQSAFNLVRLPERVCQNCRLPARYPARPRRLRVSPLAPTEVDNALTLAQSAFVNHLKRRKVLNPSRSG